MAYVRVTDLCGRETPYITDETNLDDAIRDVLAECDDATCYMGEMQYDFLESDDPAVIAHLAAGCPNCDGGGCSSCLG